MQLTRAGVWGAAALFAAIIAFGLGSAWLATRQPSIALGVETPAAIVLFLAAGLALAAAGCAAVVVYPGEAFGRLAIATSLAWFAAGWGSPGVGISLLFTAGLVLASASAPLVGHAILGYGTSRTAWRDALPQPATSRVSSCSGSSRLSRRRRPRTVPRAQRTSSPSSTRPT